MAKTCKRLIESDENSVKNSINITKNNNYEIKNCKNLTEDSENMAKNSENMAKSCNNIVKTNENRSRTSENLDKDSKNEIKNSEANENLNFLKFENKKDYDDFLKFLYSNSKDESVNDRERHISVLATKRDVVGLSMKSIRSLAKLISKNNPIEFLAISKGELYEEILIQGLVIVSLKDYKILFKYLDDWVKKIDSWGICDSVVSTMKFLNKDEIKSEYFDYFYRMCFNSQEFISRFGIVTLMTYYIEEKYIDKILDMCKSIKNNAYYVQMGIAWLISYCFVKFKEKTLALLGSKILDSFIQNKSIQKCCDSYRVDILDKQMLKTLRK